MKFIRGKWYHFQFGREDYYVHFIYIQGKRFWYDEMIVFRDSNLLTHDVGGDWLPLYLFDNLIEIDINPIKASLL